jgi:hypothetical protein
MEFWFYTDEVKVTDALLSVTIDIGMWDLQYDLCIGPVGVLKFPMLPTDRL